MPRTKTKAQHRQRHGFTMLELALVLAILVVVAAMSVPMLQRSFSNQSLKKAGDRVRAEFGRARVKAMQTGDVYAFFFRPGTGQFKVAPFGEGMLAAQFANEEDRQSHFDFARELLPRQIVFAAGDMVVDMRAQHTMEQSGMGSGSRPILFYPDGSSQDALLVLQNADGTVVEVNLRGLTGLATVSNVRLPSELER